MFVFAGTEIRMAVTLSFTEISSRSQSGLCISAKLGSSRMALHVSVFYLNLAAEHRGGKLKTTGREYPPCVIEWTGAEQR